MEKMIWNYCAKCSHSTKHTILLSKVKKDEDEYMDYGKTLYLMLECNGCEEISFRKEYHDYLETIEDEEGNEKPAVTINIFPNQLNNHKTLEPLYYLPEKIKNVYEQTILALKGGSLLLAGVGFRAAIEAICIEENIKGYSLEQKINNLAKNRLITEKEAERLHTIRFLGNDSVHEIEIPSEEKLYMVLNIVEHLLKNLYILDKDAKNLLDTIIKQYEDFESLVIDCIISKYKLGDVKTLKEILGKHIRRISIDIESLEFTLKEKIRNKEFIHLNINERIDKASPTLDQAYIITNIIPPLPF